VRCNAALILDGFKTASTKLSPYFHNTQLYSAILSVFSPFPESGLSFSTLFCRTVNVNASYLSLRLRDFPQELLSVDDIHIWGRLIGAEPVGIDRGLLTLYCIDIFREGGAGASTKCQRCKVRGSIGAVVGRVSGGGVPSYRRRGLGRMLCTPEIYFNFWFKMAIFGKKNFAFRQREASPSAPPLNTPLIYC